MRNNRMSLMMGIGALALAIVGWMLPRRRKTPMQKVMQWSANSMKRMNPIIMKSGFRMVKGMLR